jgi:GntR family transcriptional regulator
VLDDLQRRLDAGEFATSFPTDRQLTDEYGVSRHTAREAVRRLHEAGLLRRERGRGTFVRSHEIEQPVGTLYSLFRSIEDQGYVQRSCVLHIGLVTDADAAARLGVDAGTELVHLRRLRYADDVAIALDEVWLPAAIARPLLDADFEHTAVYAELDRLTGVRPTAGWERVHPALAAADERALLGISARQPVFRIERFTESNARPLEWRCTLIRGDHFTLVTRWSGAHETASAVELAAR